jgi:hypothetical protein
MNHAAMTHSTPSYDGLATGESSKMAQAFAAKIELATSDLGLFFIVGRDSSVDEAVRSVGGTIVFRLPGNQKVLAVLRLTAFHYIKQHPAISLVGPVVVDQERFARFAAMLKLEQEPLATTLATIEPAGKARTKQDKPRPNKHRRKK